MSREIRALGWVQDSADFSKLRVVVSLFSSEHNKDILPKLASGLRIESSALDEILQRLAKPGVRIKYKELIGGKKKNNGMVPVLLPGQTIGTNMSTWACAGFVSWAYALGFISYDSKDDSFTITSSGKVLLDTKIGSEQEKDERIKALLSYPPAVRVLSILSDGSSRSKYGIGQELGFEGEAGFVSYSEKLVVGAIANGSLKSSDVRDFEGTSDKYARMIAGWLADVGLVVKIVPIKGEGALPRYAIGAHGIKKLKGMNGYSKFGAVRTRVPVEILVTKSRNRKYLRVLRASVLKEASLFEVNRRFKSEDILAGVVLRLPGVELHAVDLTLHGLVRIGVPIVLDQVTKEWYFSSPVEIDPSSYDLVISGATEETQAEDSILVNPNVPLKFSALLELSKRGKEGSRDFEVLLMDYLTSHLNIPGELMGGPRKPDGVLYCGTQGVVIDAKSYSNGYTLDTAEQDKMHRYVAEWRDSSKSSDQAVAWWKHLPGGINDFAFSFVSGSFQDKVPQRVADISGRLGGIKGTALEVGNMMNVGDALLLQNKAPGEIMSHLFFS